MSNQLPIRVWASVSSVSELCALCDQSYCPRILIHLFSQTALRSPYLSRRSTLPFL